MIRVAAAMMALLLCGVTTAATINVPADYVTIQAAVDAASNGDEILVAPGTYTGAGQSVIINPGGKPVAILASGTPEETILDGEGVRRVVWCSSGEGQKTVIGGFTIRSGAAREGGGINCDNNSSPTIRNCIIQYNYSYYGHGGGIYLGSDCDAAIMDCAITNNEAWNGGGIYCTGSNPTISGCTISGNAVLGHYGNGGGGGIACVNGSNPTISGCTITNNTSFAGGVGGGGGIYCYNSSSPTISGCTISNNIASSGDGGGVFCSSGNPTITGCTISGNTATRGGGIYCNACNVTLTACTLSTNSASDGGGIHCRDSNPMMLVSGCTITDNAALDNGGGIYHYLSTVHLSNTNICGNQADQVYGGYANGGGVCLSFSCDDSDSDGVPDECQGSIGDGIHEVPEEYTTIQKAIEVAGYGDTVLVGPGTYSGTGNWVINPGGKPIVIRATAAPEETIIDGEGQRLVVQCAGGEDADTVIEGFTITGGRAEIGGGGIYCYQSDPAVLRCMITGNIAGRRGGGIYCYYANPTILACTIANNATNEGSFNNGGGGICCYYSSPMVTECTIASNTAAVDGSGGGLHLNYYSSPMISNCVISYNVVNGTYSSGGGVYCIYSSNPAFSDCVIANNTATWAGGGIYCQTDTAGPTLAQTSVCGNVPTQIIGPWTDTGGNSIADECPPDCPDVSGDGFVGVHDLLAVLEAWGGDDPDADVDGDGIVGMDDLTAVIDAWGPCE